MFDTLTKHKVTITSHSNFAADSNVAENDTLLLTTGTAYQQIETLIKSREDWEQTELQSSKERLYAVLKSCYAMYAKASEIGEYAKQLHAALETHARVKNHKFVRSSHIVTRIVKCVFGYDRKRTSCYSIALRRAFADGITPEALPAFIRDAGGVEELRLNNAKSGMSAEQKLELAANYVSKADLGTLASPELSQQLDVTKHGSLVLLVGTQHANGSVTINAVVNTASSLNHALATIYARSKANISEVSTQAEFNDSIQSLDEQLLAAALAALSQTQMN